MDQREEQSSPGTDLVELEAGVQRDVLVEGELLHLGDEVLGDGEEEEAVAEGEGGGGAPADGHAHPHDLPQVRVLGHEGEV